MHIGEKRNGEWGKKKPENIIIYTYYLTFS